MLKMSNDKKYYWLKLKRDFFKRHDTMIIESMENGEKYLLFYLKLLVESIDHEGNLRFSDTIPYNDKMLATITNTDIDIVRSAVKIFTELNMMEQFDDGTLYMNQVQSMIGNQTEWAEKKRIWREKRKLIGTDEGQKEDMSDKSIDKDIELDKDIDNIPEILIYWQTLYNQKTATTIMPNETAREQAFKLTQQVKDIELLKKCADAFFDDSQGWFFTQSKSGNNIKYIYYFKSFVSNITALIAVVQEKKAVKAKEEKKKIPRPPICPTCGKQMIEYMVGGAGCKPCGIKYIYRDKWIREK